MANELRVNLSGLNFRKTGAPSVSISATASVTVSGVNAIYASQNIGTTDETLGLGAVATIGWVYFKNLDDTHFILIGSDGSEYPIKLLPGEFGVFRWNSSEAAIHAKADTAACDIEYLVVEN